MRTRFHPLTSLVLALVLLLSACGQDDDPDVAADVTDVAGAVDASGDAAEPPSPTSQPEPSATEAPAVATPVPTSEPTATEVPIPVEPDGGIGDGAEPLPGAEEPAQQPDWHGAEVAETNCPGVTFQRVEASAFSFSVPIGFADQGAQGIDSEVAVWGTDGIEASYDFGWYSGSPSGIAGAEVTPIDYTGIVGEYVVVRDNQAWDDRNLVAVFFPEVSIEFEQANRLSLVVLFDDPGDEVIARCIVGSIEWSVG